GLTRDLEVSVYNGPASDRWPTTRGGDSHGNHARFADTGQPAAGRQRPREPESPGQVRGHLHGTDPPGMPRQRAPGGGPGRRGPGGPAQALREVTHLPVRPEEAVPRPAAPVDLPGDRRPLPRPAAAAGRPRQRRYAGPRPAARGHGPEWPRGRRPGAGADPASGRADGAGPATP